MSRKRRTQQQVRGLQARIRSLERSLKKAVDRGDGLDAKLRQAIAEINRHLKRNAVLAEQVNCYRAREQRQKNREGG